MLQDGFHHAGASGLPRKFEDAGRIQETAKVRPKKPVWFTQASTVWFVKGWFLDNLETIYSDMR